MEKRVTKNALETQLFAQKFAKTLKAGDILALYGDLGSGKTTFVQGLAQGFGITQRIISPTFIIMRTYELGIKNKELRIKNFYHVDLYRTKNERDIEGLSLKEIMEDQNNIVVIEWPEKLGAFLPKHAKKLAFKYISEEEREIRYF